VVSAAAVAAAVAAMAEVVGEGEWLQRWQRRSRPRRSKAAQTASRMGCEARISPVCSAVWPVARCSSRNMSEPGQWPASRAVIWTPSTSIDWPTSMVVIRFSGNPIVARSTRAVTEEQ